MARMVVEMDQRLIDDLKRVISKYESYSFTKLRGSTSAELAETLETTKPLEVIKKDLESAKKEQEKTRNRLEEEKKKSKEAVEKRKETEGKLNDAKERIKTLEKKIDEVEEKLSKREEEIEALKEQNPSTSACKLNFSFLRKLFSFS